MSMSRIKLGIALAVLIPCLTAPAVAEREAIGIPDAPPVERVVARHDGFDIPNEFETSDGHRFPAGSYDLALIECAGRYHLQLTNRESRRGVRVRIKLNDAATPPVADGSLQFGKGPESIRLTVGDLAATFPLHDPRKES